MITRDCSIEASSASLPFMLSWKALLMVEASMGAAAPSAARVDGAGASAGRAGVGDADAGAGAEAGMRMVGKVKVPRAVCVGSAGGGVGAVCHWLRRIRRRGWLGWRPWARRRARRRASEDGEDVRLSGEGVVLCEGLIGVMWMVGV